MDGRSYALDAQGELAAEVSRLRRQAEVLFRLDWPLVRAGLAEPPQVILEVGCGNGAYLALVGAEEPRARLVGVDRDDRLLEAARSEVPRARLVLADAADSDRLGALVREVDPDLVIVRYVLQHMPRVERAHLTTTLSSCRRAGRTVVLIEPDDSRASITPSCAALSLAVQGNIQRQAALGGDRCLGARLASLATDAGFVEVRAAHVDIGCATVGWDALRNVFWPVARQGLSAHSPSERTLLDEEVERWFERGPHDPEQDWRKPLYVVAAR